MVFIREQQQGSQLLIAFQGDEGLGSESKTHPTVLRALEFLLPTILDVFMSCFLKILKMMLCCYHNNWCGLCCCWEFFLFKIGKTEEESKSSYLLGWVLKWNLQKQAIRDRLCLWYGVAEGQGNQFKLG